MPRGHASPARGLRGSMSPQGRRRSLTTQRRNNPLDSPSPGGHSDLNTSGSLSSRGRRPASTKSSPKTATKLSSDLLSPSPAGRRGRGRGSHSRKTQSPLARKVLERGKADTSASVERTDDILPFSDISTPVDNVIGSDPLLNTEESSSASLITDPGVRGLSGRGLSGRGLSGRALSGRGISGRGRGMKKMRGQERSLRGRGIDRPLKLRGRGSGYRGNGLKFRGRGVHNSKHDHPKRRSKRDLSKNEVEAASFMEQGTEADFTSSSLSENVKKTNLTTASRPAEHRRGVFEEFGMLCESRSESESKLSTFPPNNPTTASCDDAPTREANEEKAEEIKLTPIKRKNYSRKLFGVRRKYRRSKKSDVSDTCQAQQTEKEKGEVETAESAVPAAEHLLKPAPKKRGRKKKCVFPLQVAVPQTEVAGKTESPPVSTNAAQSQKSLLKSEHKLDRAESEENLLEGSLLDSSIGSKTDLCSKVKEHDVYSFKGTDDELSSFKPLSTGTTSLRASAVAAAVAAPTDESDSFSFNEDDVKRDLVKEACGESKVVSETGGGQTASHSGFSDIPIVCHNAANSEVSIGSLHAPFDDSGSVLESTLDDESVQMNLSLEDGEQADIETEEEDVKSKFNEGDRNAPTAAKIARRKRRSRSKTKEDEYDGVRSLRGRKGRTRADSDGGDSNATSVDTQKVQPDDLEGFGEPWGESTPIKSHLSDDTLEEDEAVPVHNVPKRGRGRPRSRRGAYRGRRKEIAVLEPVPRISADKESAGTVAACDILAAVPDTSIINSQETEVNKADDDAGHKEDSDAKNDEVVKPGEGQTVDEVHVRDEDKSSEVVNMKTCDDVDNVDIAPAAELGESCELNSLCDDEDIRLIEVSMSDSDETDSQATVVWSPPSQASVCGDVGSTPVHEQHNGYEGVADDNMLLSDTHADDSSDLSLEMSPSDEEALKPPDLHHSLPEGHLQGHGQERSDIKDDERESDTRSQTQGPDDDEPLQEELMSMPGRGRGAGRRGRGRRKRGGRWKRGVINKPRKMRYRSVDSDETKGADKDVDELQSSLVDSSLNIKGQRSEINSVEEGTECGASDLPSVCDKSEISVKRTLVDENSHTNEALHETVGALNDNKWLTECEGDRSVTDSVFDGGYFPRRARGRAARGRGISRGRGRREVHGDETSSSVKSVLRGRGGVGRRRGRRGRGSRHQWTRKVRRNLSPVAHELSSELVNYDESPEIKAKDSVGASGATPNLDTCDTSPKNACSNEAPNDADLSKAAFPNPLCNKGLSGRKLFRESKTVESGLYYDSDGDVCITVRRQSVRESLAASTQCDLTRGYDSDIDNNAKSKPSSASEDTKLKLLSFSPVIPKYNTDESKTEIAQPLVQPVSQPPVAPSDGNQAVKTVKSLGRGRKKSEVELLQEVDLPPGKRSRIKSYQESIDFWSNVIPDESFSAETGSESEKVDRRKSRTRGKKMDWSSIASRRKRARKEESSYAAAAAAAAESAKSEEETCDSPISSVPSMDSYQQMLAMCKPCRVVIVDFIKCLDMVRLQQGGLPPEDTSTLSSSQCTSPTSELTEGPEATLSDPAFASAADAGEAAPVDPVATDAVKSDAATTQSTDSEPSHEELEPIAKKSRLRLSASEGEASPEKLENLRVKPESPKLRRKQTSRKSSPSSSLASEPLGLEPVEMIEQKQVSEQSEVLKSKPIRLGKSIEKYRCLHCRYTTNVRGVMEEHIYNHTSLVPYSCGHCGAIFGTKSGVNVHTRKQHKGQLARLVKNLTHVREEEHYTTVSHYDEMGGKLEAPPLPGTHDIHSTDAGVSEADAAEGTCSDTTSAGSVKSDSRSDKVSVRSRIPVIQVADPALPYYQCKHCTYASNEKPDIEWHVSETHSDEREIMCAYCKKTLLKGDASIRSHFTSLHPGSQVAVQFATDYNTVLVAGCQGSLSVQSKDKEAKEADVLKHLSKLKPLMPKGKVPVPAYSPASQAAGDSSPKAKHTARKSFRNQRSSSNVEKAESVADEDTAKPPIILRIPMMYVREAMSSQTESASSSGEDSSPQRMSGVSSEVDAHSQVTPTATHTSQLSPASTATSNTQPDLPSPSSLPPSAASTPPLPDESEEPLPEMEMEVDEVDEDAPFALKISSVVSLSEDKVEEESSGEEALSPSKSNVIKKTYSCKFCSFSTKEKAYMVNHIEFVHQMDYHYTCPYCEFQDTTHKNNIMDHMEKIHPDVGDNISFDLVDQDKYFDVVETRLPVTGSDGALASSADIRKEDADAGASANAEKGGPLNTPRSRQGPRPVSMVGPMIKGQAFISTSQSSSAAPVTVESGMQYTLGATPVTVSELSVAAATPILSPATVVSISTSNAAPLLLVTTSSSGSVLHLPLNTRPPQMVLPARLMAPPLTVMATSNQSKVIMTHEVRKPPPLIPLGLPTAPSINELRAAPPSVLPRGTVVMTVQDQRNDTSSSESRASIVQPVQAISRSQPKQKVPPMQSSDQVDEAAQRAAFSVFNLRGPQMQEPRVIRQPVSSLSSAPPRAPPPPYVPPTYPPPNPFPQMPLTEPPKPKKEGPSEEEMKKYRMFQIPRGTLLLPSATPSQPQIPALPPSAIMIPAYPAPTPVIPQGAMLNCMYCHEKLPSRQELHDHLLTHRSIIWTCPYCPNTPQLKRTQVELHIRTQHPGCKVLFRPYGV